MANLNVIRKDPELKEKNVLRAIRDFNECVSSALPYLFPMWADADDVDEAFFSKFFKLVSVRLAALETRLGENYSGAEEALDPDMEADVVWKSTLVVINHCLECYLYSPSGYPSMEEVAHVAHAGAMLSLKHIAKEAIHA